MDRIPTTLTAEQAEEITQLLRDARNQLRDAAGSRIYAPNYASTSARVAEALRAFDIDPN